MDWEEEDIATALQEALQELAGQQGKALAEKIERVVFINLERGRATKYLSDNHGSRPQEYVALIAGNHEQLGDYLHRVQIEKLDAVWTPLSSRMKSWAYNFLVSKNFERGKDTLQRACDYSADAAATLVNSHFPYDTEFDAWAMILTHNVCRAGLRQDHRHPIEPGNEVNADDEWLANIPDLLQEEGVRNDELQRDLSRAIQRLPKELRQIVRLYYQHLSPAKIAKTLEMEASVIYRRKFKAMRDLRRIMNGYGY